jgi:hypothetical protein
LYGFPQTLFHFATREGQDHGWPPTPSAIVVNRHQFTSMEQEKENAPASRSIETDEDDNRRETTDGMVEEMGVAGLMPGEPSVELEQATQHQADKALLAEATDETTTEAPDGESTAEEASENLEVSPHNRAANAAPESAVEILQPNATGSVEEATEALEEL